MKAKLLAIIASPAVRKAFISLLLAAAAAAGVSMSGCGAQPPKSPALAVFQCRAAAVAPFVGEAAPQVVAAIADSQNPIQFLLSLGLSPEDIMAVVRAYRACEPDAGAPLPDAAPADAAAGLPEPEAN